MDVLLKVRLLDSRLKKVSSGPYGHRLQAWVREHWIIVGLVLILAVGLTVRALLVDSGLPYITHWDEPKIANTALEMMKTGDLNPHFFNYGSLLIYLNLGVDIAHYLHLAGRPEEPGPSLATLDDLEVGLGSEFPWHVSHPSFYAWNRFLNAVFGTGCVLLCFLLGVQIRDERAGLIAAFFLAILPFHVENSALVKTDIPASFFAILTVWLAAGFVRNQRPGWLAMAAAAGGLATSIKYNLATCLIVPLGVLVVASLRRSPGYRHWQWPALILLPFSTFLAGTPYALFDLRTFLDHVGFEVRHYLIAGHSGFSIAPGIPHLWMDLQQILNHVGVLSALLAVVGLLVSLRSKLGLIVFAFPILQLWLTARTAVDFHRNLLVVYPFVALALGIGLVWLLDRLERPVAERLPRRRKVFLAGAWTLLIVATGATSLPMLAETLEKGRRVETRSLAVTHVNRLLQDLPGRWNQVYVAAELRLHPLDEKRIRAPYSIHPTIDLLCQPPPEGLLMIGSHYKGRGSDEAAAALRIHDLLAEGDEIVATIKGAPLWLDRYSRRPGILLLEPTAMTASRSTDCSQAQSTRSAAAPKKNRRHRSQTDDGAKSNEPADPTAVILIGVDTLRADHLGIYGHQRPTSPHLDRWARDGMVFDWAFSTSPWTLPTFASLFTGRTPTGHGARVRLFEDREGGESTTVLPAPDPEEALEIRGHFARLDPSIPTVAAMMATRGFETIGVVQNPILSPAFGLDQGFDVYDFEAGDNVESRRADEVVDRALQWVDRLQRSSSGFFLFLHFFDPHLNYDAPPPFRGMFTRGIPSELQLPIRGQKTIRSRLASLPPADKDFIEAAYDEEVRFLDEELDRLFGGLSERGVWNEALVILTSDHGEEFFEHGGFEHGHEVFNEQVHVPLVVWGPGVAPGRQPTPVSLADVAPTILDAVGIEQVEGMSAASLWPFLAAGEPVVSRPVFMEATMYGAERKAVVRWPYKLAVVPELERERLFDLSRDPLETQDLAGQRAALTAVLWQDLVDPRHGGLLPAAEQSNLSQEMIDKLRSLGYIR